MELKTNVKSYGANVETHKGIHGESVMHVVLLA